ncbi:MAG: PEP-CTERM sorting domain-containing protein [Opitutaceae bacterium]
MKKIASFSFLLSAVALNLNASVSIAGTASTAVTNLDAGDSTFVIVDTSGGDTLNAAAFIEGLNLKLGASFGDYYVAGANTVLSFFSTFVPGNAIFHYIEGGFSEGDRFYVVAFDTNVGEDITLNTGDTFGILSDVSWALPNDNGATFAYGSHLAQFNDIDGAAFTVVPEPSTFAMLTGMLALSAVVMRRRGRANR